MTEFLILGILLLASFTGCSDMEHKSIMRIQTACSAHAGVSTYREFNVFGWKSTSAVCGDGTTVTLPGESK